MDVDEDSRQITRDVLAMIGLIALLMVGFVMAAVGFIVVAT